MTWLKSEWWLPSGLGVELNSDLHGNCGWESSLNTHIALFPGAVSACMKKPQMDIQSICIVEEENNI